MGKPNHGSNRAGRADAALHLHAARALPRSTEEQFVLFFHTRAVAWTLCADAHRPVLYHRLFHLFWRHLFHLFCHFHEFVHTTVSLRFPIITLSDSNVNSCRVNPQPEYFLTSHHARSGRRSALSFIWCSLLPLLTSCACFSERSWS